MRVILRNNLRIPVAHIQGGDISGNLDEVFRHAITKMSHIHFPSTKDSAERIKKMGEDEWRIHTVGDAHLDLIGSNLYTDEFEVREKYNLGDERYIIVLQHSVNTEPECSYDQMQKTLTAVKKIEIKTLIVYPCSDQGYEGIIKAIEECKNDKNLYVYKNIDAPDFIGLMNNAEVLVGNSSAGIIEAPMFKLPTVNIGKRQNGRQRDRNVVDVEGETSNEISQAIERALYHEDFRDTLKQCGSIYGEGKTGEQIVKILKTIELGDHLFEKKMTY